MKSNKPSETEIDEFIKQSNAIERESSQKAFDDAKSAWIIANENEKEFNKIDYILRIHKKLLGRLAPHYAGKIREVPVYIGGEKRDQSKEEIILQLNELIILWNKQKDILKHKRKQDKEYFVKQWHILFEKAHMACDGNGRSGRILMNVQRLNLGLPILIIHTGQQQAEYYTWFKRKKVYLWEYQKKKIIKEYGCGNGKYIKEIAREMKIYPQVIRHLLIKNNIKITKRNNAQKGEKNSNWKGGIRHIKGYRHFYNPKHNLARKDGWVLESRAIMQQKLGRNLLPEEVVHHKDEDVSNNNPSNLEVHPNNGEHRKNHLKENPQKRNKLGIWIKEK